MTSGPTAMRSALQRGTNVSALEQLDDIRGVHDFWNSASCGEDFYLRIEATK